MTRFTLAPLNDLSQYPLLLGRQTVGRFEFGDGRLAAGAQARAHAEAMRCIRDFGELRVWGCMPEKAAALAEQHGCVAISAEDAVRGADVVVTATRPQEPVLKGK